MDEREWLECDNPKPMQQFLETRTSTRLARLYRCACCRHIWSLITDDQLREAVEVAERYVDELATAKELEQAYKKAAEVEAANGGLYDVDYMPLMASEKKMSMLWVAETAANHADGWMAPYCDLLRDLFGNPFRPVALDAAWRTPAVLALAQAAYDNRTLPAGTLEPDRLAVLADALEESGCTDAELLGHLRGPGPHVRGCFVIDAILDKK